MEGNFIKSLPPGYKFKPTDEELVDFYLKRKTYKIPLPPVNIFRDVDLYKYDPFTLTGMCDNATSWNDITTEWYFFTPRDRKYPKGSRPGRSAGDGYWKATGKPTPVISGEVEVGSKRSLVYCRGKSPNGEKTDWIMHEYVLAQSPPRQRLNDQDMQLDWVLCRVYKKREPRSKSGNLVEGCNDKEQEENGISSDALKTVMPQRTSSVPFSNQYNDYMFPRYSESFGAGTMPAPLASMPLYHQFQSQVPTWQHFSGAGSSNLNFTASMDQEKNFTASDGFTLDVQQEEVDNGAILAKSEAGVMENGHDALNTLITFPGEFDDCLLPEFPDFCDSMLGENPTSYGCQETVFDDFSFTSTPTPLASISPNDQFQPLHFEPQMLPHQQQQQLSVDYQSNYSFTEADRYILNFEK
ncbi:NAC domain-containing protein 2-like [Hibiscus syriacus]|uniref:NAC domain-containing protein 2-like n=1 Tax=Hibiscus syriacus TaxID=106335 RepID=UPI00192361D1|nr:NAC domain-containing protein 2-like [Hibiscus syriacus]